MSKWFFAIDRGGTFTDVIGIDPSNKLHKLKLLSESLLYEDSVIEGIRRLLRLNSNQKIPLNLIDRIRIGTTIATNALLERKGAKTALLITKGFRDLLEIGNQSRPRLFEGIVTGTLASVYQSTRIQKICNDLDLWCFNRVVRTHSYPNKRLFRQQVTHIYDRFQRLLLLPFFLLRKELYMSV